MASWRVGYMVIPERLADAVNKIQDTLLICPPAASQRAALAALAVGASYPRGYLAGLDEMRRRISTRSARRTCRVTSRRSRERSTTWRGCSRGSIR